MTDLLAREKTTNANSPPWDRSNPILTLSCIVSPTRGPIAVIINVLITINPAKSESTFGHSRKRSCKAKRKKKKNRLFQKCQVDSLKTCYFIREDYMYLFYQTQLESYMLLCYIDPENITQNNSRFLHSQWRNYLEKNWFE